jgi:hypothetical protein
MNQNKMHIPDNCPLLSRPVIICSLKWCSNDMVNVSIIRETIDLLKRKALNTTSEYSVLLCYVQCLYLASIVNIINVFLAWYKKCQ